MSAKVLAFPTRPVADAGVLLGRPATAPLCTCGAPMRVFVAHWARRKDSKANWLCTSCGSAYAHQRTSPGQAAAGSPGAGGAPVVTLPADGGGAAGSDEWGYEAWVAGNGMIRIASGDRTMKDLAGALTITVEQARQIGRDFIHLADAADEQLEQLRGDDRWRVRPCPGRPGVYLIKGKIWAGMYREVPFVAIKIKKPRRCEPCGINIAADSTMYREEIPEPGANVSWRDVRICAECVSRVDRGSPESPAATPPQPAGERGPEGTTP